MRGSLKENELLYQGPFRVEAGKITLLPAKPGPARSHFCRVGSKALKHFFVLHAFLASACLLLGCQIFRPEGMDEASKNMVDMSIVALINGQYTVSITDNMNGTVSVSRNYTYTGAVSTFLYKKCLQGQVFRAAQNDCQGIGTPANKYGAQLLQFCSQNDYSCGESILMGTGLSPAYNSCQSENLLSRQWRVGEARLSFDDPAGAFGVYEPQFRRIYPDIVETDQIWTFFDSSLSQAYYLEFRKGYVYRGTDTKTNLKYVLCQAKG